MGGPLRDLRAERVAVYVGAGQALYASWLPPYGALLAWAITFVVLFYLLALWMDRRGIYLKA